MEFWALQGVQVTHVAMEATGVYWKPVWQVLCHDFNLILANASHIRNVPGRKSDANDATWIADLLAHGLIRASFVPPQPIQDVRDLTRTRRELTREIRPHTQRIQATLEESDIQGDLGPIGYPQPQWPTDFESDRRGRRRSNCIGRIASSSACLSA